MGAPLLVVVLLWWWTWVMVGVNAPTPCPRPFVVAAAAWREAVSTGLSVDGRGSRNAPLVACADCGLSSLSRPRIKFMCGSCTKDHAICRFHRPQPMAAVVYVALCAIYGLWTMDRSALCRVAFDRCEVLLMSLIDLFWIA